VPAVGAILNVVTSGTSGPAVLPPPSIATPAQPSMPPAPGGRPSPAPVPARPSGVCQWVSLIASGRPFLVVFDLAKFDDTGWNGPADPMGALKAGEHYEVTYHGAGFQCTGFDESTNRAGTRSSGGADPRDGLLSLWGRVFAFDGKGQVWDPDFGLVGHLEPK